MNGPLIVFIQGIEKGDATIMLSSLVVIALLLLVCFPVHEFAHAYTASMLGDNTAQLLGRITLNPLAHLDPVGSILFLVAGFGWAKPVPVTPRRLNGNPQTSMAIIAAAGPISNALLAIAFAILYRAMHPFLGSPGNFVAHTVEQALITAVSLNLLLALFNLIPIPPLDGSRILAALLPEEGARFMSMIERYGFMVLILVTYMIPGLMNSLVMSPASSLARLLLGY